MNWQPMSTAPKGEDWILAYSEECGILIVGWEATEGVWEAQPGGWGCERYPEHGEGSLRYWQPLPDLPVVEMPEPTPEK